MSNQPRVALSLNHETERLQKNFRKIKQELASNKRLCALISGYALAITIIYAIPIGSQYSEWYTFYSYLSEQQATPYVDLREGYPPLGFLIYYPLYHLFQGNPTAFSFAFRALNALLLISTLLILYLTLKAIFGKTRSLKLTLYYALLPSVIISNAYSNDIVALFPSALAIYMMTKRRAYLCGLLIATATLGKGFPLLLLIPALIAFTNMKEKIKLVLATFGALILASLPFLTLNPLTFISTFTHVGSRGPWETPWAFIEGYYSHGGFLHPLFDKFFYHSNLLRIYSASPYDHAIYKWKFEALPTFLTICQITIILIVSLVYIKRKTETAKLCGLIYTAYLFFFKGYSTQFATSTPFYAFLASAENPVPILLPLETSHLMQMISWGFDMIAQEGIRDWHMPILVSSVFLRTAVFLWIILNNILSANISLKQNITYFISKLLETLKLFKDKKAAALILAVSLTAAPTINILHSGMENQAQFKIQQGNVRLSIFEWKNLTIKELEKGDQVIIKLNTHNWVYAQINPNDLKAPLERGIRNPYHLKDSFNETLLFFRAESNTYNLTLKLAHPAMPFRVTDGLEGDLETNITNENYTLVFNFKDNGADGKNSFFRIAYPINAIADKSFQLALEYNATEGLNVLLDVFDDTDEWLYAFNTTERFILKPNSKNLLGNSNLHGDKISLIALAITIKDNSSQTLKLKKLSLNNQNKTYHADFYAQNSTEVFYEVFTERDWKPPALYNITLPTTTALFFTLLYYLQRKGRIAETKTTEMGIKPSYAQHVLR